MIQNDKTYRLLFENMHNGFALHEIVIDQDQNPVDFIFLEVNAAFEQMTGLKKTDILDRRVTKILPEIKADTDRWISIYGRVAQSGKPDHFEEYSRLFDRWYSIQVFSPGRGSFATILQDITEVKQAEKKVRQNLKEKEILLRELNHRTKNNMQVITSILRLKARSLQCEDLQFILRDIENKIQAMALVHQKLYESPDLCTLSLRSYLEDLIRYIRVGILPGDERIKLIYTAEEMFVVLDTAVPLGLILNELLSNAAKHAFPHGRNGEIHVKLRTLSGESLMIEVIDNGVGIPDGFDIEKDVDLGLETVIHLVMNQLDGTVEFENFNGFSCRIRLKGKTQKHTL